MCAAAISFARIRRLYYGAADPKGGAVDNGVRFFASPTCHHRPEVYGGIGESRGGGAAEGFLSRRGARAQQRAKLLLQLGLDALGGAQDRARLEEIERAEDADIGPQQQVGRAVLELLRR